MAETRISDAVVHVSTLSFAETLSRLVERITHAGMTIFATIDHAANAQTVGMNMPPATVLIYGNPKGGTPIMLAAPLAALDLPLHVLVQGRADGSVAVVFHPIDDILIRAGVPQEVAVRLEPAQQMLLPGIVR